MNNGSVIDVCCRFFCTKLSILHDRPSQQMHRLLNKKTHGMCTHKMGKMLLVDNLRRHLSPHLYFVTLKNDAPHISEAIIALKLMRLFADKSIQGGEHSMLY
jgi:hypothetical protein